MSDYGSGNINAIKTRYPDWDLQNLDRDEDVHELFCNIEYSETGQMIPCISIEGNNYYLSGKHDPQKLNEYYSKILLDNKSVALIIVFGFGDGGLLRELIANAEDTQRFICYEPSLTVFRQIVENFDISDLILDEKLKLIVEGTGVAQINSIVKNTFNTDNIDNCIEVIHPNYSNIFPEKVKEFKKVIKAEKNYFNVYWSTKIYYKKEYITNVLMNMQFLYNHYSVNTFQNFLAEKNIPVIIVGAGPSLDKNIDKLKRAKGKSIIIACDTALKPLLNHDIEPDLFIVVDPVKPIELFENDKIWTIPMIADMVVPYEIYKRHKAAKFIYWNDTMSNKAFTALWGENWMENHAMNSLKTGGNVASTAYSVAELMGTKTVIFVGQDLALTNGAIHANNTFADDADDPNRKKLMVEDINGGLVETRSDFFVYLKWFEAQIEENPDIHFVDATEGGAKIHGTEILTLEEAIDKYCVNKTNIDEMFMALPKHFMDEDRNGINKYILNLENEIECFEKLADEEEKAYKRLNEIVRNPFTMTEAGECMKEIQEIGNSLQGYDLYQIITDAIADTEWDVLKSVNTKYDSESEEITFLATQGLKVIGKINAIIPEAKELILTLNNSIKERL